MTVIDIKILAPVGQLGLQCDTGATKDATELEKKYAAALQGVIEGVQRSLEAKARARGTDSN